MFDTDVADLDKDATLAAVEGNEHGLIEGELRRLLLAAHWADLHPGDAVDPDGLPGRERPIRPGGDGTPEIADFCPAELGCSLKLSAGSTRTLIADALDLRHRLPCSWAAVLAGQGPVYEARHIAKATRHLSVEQAGQVDVRVAPAIGTLPWGRLQALLDGLIYDADPEGADAAAERAARERFVRLGRVTEHGMRLIVARITAGDAAWGDAVITRLAEVLRRDGDFASVDIRRSKALGILITQPAEALRLLNAHQDDDDDPAQSPQPDPLPEVDDQPEGATGNGPAGNADLALRQAQGTDGSQSQGAEGGSRSLRIGPPPFDPAKARPRAVVYVHVSEEALRAGRGVIRVEDIGPVLLTRLGQVLGDRCQIQLKPVIDLNDRPAPVDCYEIPARIAEQVRLRQPFDVFPYATGGSRRTDLDHTLRYLSMNKGGPPGQTGVGTLGPHVRYHHRVKTHGGWNVRQPEPGTWVWRTPHGRIFLVNSSGTHPLGKGAFAQQIWRAANAPPDPVVVSPFEKLLQACLDDYGLAT